MGFCCLAEQKKSMSASASPVSTSVIEYIRFNPAVDLKPAYLQPDCSMLEVNAFIDHQAFHYISSGFK